MPFKPEEILFSPTSECNLSCPHCNNLSIGHKRLPARAAIRFLRECRALGSRRVGFTGGEPFLAPAFLRDVIKAAVREGYLFDRIMTNGVWWNNVGAMAKTLSAVKGAGYDGSICVSYDAFHSQRTKRVRRFIDEAVRIWRQPDIVSIASVRGARDVETRAMLKSLARSMRSVLGKSPAGHLYIEGGSVFVRVLWIDLSPIGKAQSLANPWNGRWFRDDRCSGPGNSFLVMPDGDVKPCCGYASDNDALTIGNIKRHSAGDIMKNLESNRFVSAVFSSGLSSIRKRLERSGVGFPGRTQNNCFFCGHILTAVPKGVLDRCLGA